MLRKPKHRRSARSSSSRRHNGSRRWRRAKVFLWLNLALWAAIGAWFLLQPAERQQEVKRLVSNAAQGKKDITAFEVAWDLWQLYYGKDYVAISGAEGRCTPAAKLRRHQAT